MPAQLRLLVTAAGALLVGAFVGKQLPGPSAPHGGDAPSTAEPPRRAALSTPNSARAGLPPSTVLPAELAAALAHGTPFMRDLALHQLAEGSDQKFLVRAIEQTAGTGQSAGGRSAASGIFLQRLTELAPQAAVAQINGAATVDGGFFTRIVFGTWAETDLESAIEGVRQVRQPHLRQLAGDTIVAVWGALDGSQVDWIISRLPATYQSTSARNRLLARKVAQDPVAALTDAMQAGERVTRWKQVAAVAQVWAQTDPVGALAHAATIEEANARLAFERAVIDRWAKADPRAAIAQIAQQRRSTERGRMLLKILDQLTPVDPQAALQWAAELESVQGHSGYSQAVLKQLAEHDAPLAADQLSRLVDAHARRQVVPTIAVALARQRPEEVLSWVDSLASRAEREAAFSAAVNAVAMADPAMALGMLQTAPGGKVRDDALEGTVKLLADRQPQEAASFLALLPLGSQQHSSALQSLAFHWGRSDPYAALDWARQLPDAQRAKAVPTTLGLLAQVDVLAAANLVETLAGRERQDAISQVARRYSDQQPRAALSWVKRFEGEQGYDASLSAVMTTWANRDPRAALRALEQLQPGQVEQLAPQLMNQWADADPASAGAWVERLPAPAQASAAHAVASNWARTDMREAVEWAAGLRSDAGRDSALSAALSSGWNQHSDFADEAIDWVAEIQDPGRQESTAMQVLRQLARQDPAAARANLDRVPLSPNHRARLLQQIEAYERNQG